MTIKSRRRKLRSFINELSKDERNNMENLLNRMNIKIPPDDSLTGTKVRAFYLEGKRYSADSYIEILEIVLKIVFKTYHQASDKILSITGKKKKYFSKKPEDLRMPRLIKGTDIYFETNENAKTLHARCEKR